MQPRRLSLDCGLLAQAEFGNQCGVTLRILGLEVVQQLAPTAHHAQQAATTVVVLGVGLEVGGEFVDTGRQQCDLHFRAAGITGLAGVVGDE